MKVKLRVPFSTGHARETSSPLANPIRNAPDYSDEEQDGSIVDGVNEHSMEQDDDGQNMEENEGEPDDEEADELDEMDELEDDQEPTTQLPVTSSSSTPKRKSITLRARASNASKENDHGTISPSPSTSMGDGSMSPMSTEAYARLQAARKAGIHPRSSAAKSMTVEELDALPAAKRRKSAKARGAAGPGRGWRKGLTKGQKPVYELPPHQRTPVTFGNTSESAAPSSPISGPADRGLAAKASSNGPDAHKRSSPAIARTTSSSVAAKTGTSSAPNSKLASGPAASPSVKTLSGSGSQTFVGDLSAKAGTAKNPGFRYPPLPSSRGGPPVQPLARIPTAFQTVVPLEKNDRQPRRWVKAPREVLSMGGRPWYVSVYYGDEDRGYEKYAESVPNAAPVPGGAKIGGAPTPVPSTTNATSGAERRSMNDIPSHVANQDSIRAAKQQGASRAVSPPTEPLSRSDSASSLAKGNSGPLPPPKHLSGLRESEADWRGQSPAYLFGSR